MNKLYPRLLGLKTIVFWKHCLSVKHDSNFATFATYHPRISFTNLIECKLVSHQGLWMNTCTPSKGVWCMVFLQQLPNLLPDIVTHRCNVSCSAGRGWRSMAYWEPNSKCSNPSITPETRHTRLLIHRRCFACKCIGHDVGKSFWVMNQKNHTIHPLTAYSR